MTELRRKNDRGVTASKLLTATRSVRTSVVSADFAKHFKAPPDQLGPEHIREYQLLLVQQKKLSWSPFNQAVCALRFFYHDVLHRNWMIEHIPYPRHEQRLPVVLSPAEVAALFQSTPNLKHRTIMMTIYAAGLRVSELINLRVTDIDSQRQLICDPSGKRPQGSSGDALTEVARGAADLLEALPAHGPGSSQDAIPERPIVQTTIRHICDQAVRPRI